MGEEEEQEEREAEVRGGGGGGARPSIEMVHDGSGLRSFGPRALCAALVSWEYTTKQYCLSPAGGSTPIMVRRIYNKKISREAVATAITLNAPDPEPQGSICDGIQSAPVGLSAGCRASSRGGCRAGELSAWPGSVPGRGGRARGGGAHGVEVAEGNWPGGRFPPTNETVRWSSARLGVRARARPGSAGAADWLPDPAGAC